MTHHYATPGVYIEEQTGPGVIAGVSTSNAAFIGPALRGPLKEASRISSFDEFLELYALRETDGSFWPYITTPRWLYMAHAVRGFFENGGQQAYIVRVGTARAAAWDVKNKSGENIFRVQAKDEGVGGNDLTVQLQSTHATGAAGVALATGTATITGSNGLDVIVGNAAAFQPGDIVTVTQQDNDRATITQKVGNTLTLSKTIGGLALNATLRVANIIPAQNTFRVVKTDGLYSGTVAQMSGTDDTNNPVSETVVIESVDQAGFVTLAQSPARTKKYSLAAPLVLISEEFGIIITPSGASADSFDNLSLNPAHPNYVFSAVGSIWVRILPPDVPPTAAYPNALVDIPAGNGTVAVTVVGKNDDPAQLTFQEFRAGLDVLRNVDDANLVCIPDAVAYPDCLTIQKDMITHCLQLQDRFAILDSKLDMQVSGSGSVEEYRGFVQAERGFAALYYPWLEVPEPIKPPRQRPATPSRLPIPPSGHIAGVYARIDAAPGAGVHKAPANIDVRGVLGLERRLSNEQQGPLNLKGINVLRIFPGSGQVTVWGARTTVDPIYTDWVYVNVRRLFIFLEQSIEVGIRWAVFEPNNLQLWQKLKRTITEFLTRVWRDGALFGATADKAFYVRIDEALNPPSTQALGRLYIEIGVRPAYPAEFIIVRIGIWQGGAEVSE